MRPVDDIDPEFFALDEPLTGRLPLLDAWLDLPRDPREPLAGYVALLVQHQLSNQSDDLDQTNIHSDLSIDLVDRTVTFGGT